LVLLLVIHLVEEVRTGFRRRIPTGEMPLGLFIGINVLIYSYCVLMLLFAFTSNPIAVPMAWIFAVAMLLNGVAHIAMMVFTKAYFPGGVTALLLIPASLNVARILITY
jgi:hypothetical protein